MHARESLGRRTVLVEKPPLGMTDNLVPVCQNGELRDATVDLVVDLFAITLRPLLASSRSYMYEACWCETADPEVVVAEYDYVIETDVQTVTVASIQVVRVRDGLIVESRDYHDHVGWRLCCARAGPEPARVSPTARHIRRNGPSAHRGDSPGAGRAVGKDQRRPQGCRRRFGR